MTAVDTVETENGFLVPDAPACPTWCYRAESGHNREEDWAQLVADSSVITRFHQWMLDGPDINIIQNEYQRADGSYYTEPPFAVCYASERGIGLDQLRSLQTDTARAIAKFEEITRQS